MKSPETAGSCDYPPVLEEILKNAVRALGGSAAAAATWDEAARRYVIAGSYGVDQQQLARIHPWLNEAIPDLAESRQQFALLSELNPGGLLPVSRSGQTLNSIMALPLSIGGTTIGLIYVLRSFGAVDFSRLDPPVLEAFAAQAAIALQNARLAHLLAQEKRRVELILEGSADGIYTVDAHRRLAGLNSAMERLLGRSAEEVIGQHCSRALNLCNWEGRPLCPGSCPMLSKRDSANSVVELAGRIQTPEGKTTDVAVVYSIVYSPEGSPLNAVVNVRDISRIREMENLRSVFLSMLGHQLQTPLSIIKGYANTLARSDGHFNPAMVRQSAEIIEEEADRLSQLMNRLLLASRLESGELILNRELVQLEGLTHRVVRRLEPMSRSHNFSVDFPLGFPPVSGDPALLEEVLINLADNAIKYSPEGGVIHIGGEVADHWLTVSVIDQGVGIPWWESSRIFQRFQRGTRQSSVETRGMGLGLYICNAIVTAHGGRIDLSSEPGQGSRFSMVLPRNPSD
jgi:PAS domain S-box-containing protein